MGTHEGKVAVVTGSSQGIGAACALDLASAGANVVITYSTNKLAAERVLEHVEAAGGHGTILQANTASLSGADALVNAVAKQYSAIDILVNNAGVYKTDDIAAVASEEVHRQFDLNVFGLIYVTKQFVTSGLLGKGGRVVNIGSSVSSFNPAGSVVYNATKSAVDSITRTLANELGPTGIRVNSVNPGLTETPGMLGTNFSSDEFRQWVVSNTPLRRIGVPEDIAPAVTFLSSDSASWITGETLIIGGGLR